MTRAGLLQRPRQRKSATFDGDDRGLPSNRDAAVSERSVGAHPM